MFTAREMYQNKQCNRLTVAGHRLAGDLTCELNAVNLVECLLHCVRKPSDCKSINYRPTKRNDYSINCQLVNATKKTHPQNVVLHQSYNNYEPMEMVFLVIFELLEKFKKIIQLFCVSGMTLYLSFTENRKTS